VPLVERPSTVAGAVGKAWYWHNTPERRKARRRERRPALTYKQLLVLHTLHLHGPHRIGPATITGAAVAQRHTTALARKGYVLIRRTHTDVAVACLTAEGAARARRYD
jgi:DNA-binding MarR family transcriptional regulator